MNSLPKNKRKKFAISDYGYSRAQMELSELGSLSFQTHSYYVIKYQKVLIFIEKKMDKKNEYISINLNI